MLQENHIIQQTGMLGRQFMQIIISHLREVDRSLSGKPQKLSSCLRVAASAKAGRPPSYVEAGNPKNITKITFSLLVKMRVTHKILNKAALERFGSIPV
jgi:hypothetical protein